MRQFLSRWRIIAGLSVLLFWAAGCEPDSSGVVRAETYSTNSVAAPATHTVSLINDIGGEIVVIIGDTAQMVMEVTAISTSYSNNAAIFEAESQISMTNQLLADGNTREIRIFRVGESDHDDQALLHLQVPSGTVLSRVTNHSGDILLFGNLGDVTATTLKGNIQVIGGSGNLNLETRQGSIIVDVLRRQTLTLSATDGDIHINAHDTTVTATASNGSLSFSGDFHHSSDNQLTTSVTGSLHIALLNPESYRVYATSAISQLSSDFSPAPTLHLSPTLFAVCGFIRSGSLEMHRENTLNRFARLEITSPSTETLVYTGLLSSTFYRFETNQPHVAFFLPQPIEAHAYDEPQISLFSDQRKPDPDCQAAWASTDDDPVQFTLHLRTDRGLIQIHQIARQP